MGIPEHLTCHLRNLYAGQEATVRMGHGTMDWFQTGKEYVKAVYCHPAYLTYTQSTSCEMLWWMKHKLESRLPGEISITSDMQMLPTLWQKRRGIKEPWWKWKESGKPGSKFNIQNTKIMASGPIPPPRFYRYKREEVILGLLKFHLLLKHPQCEQTQPLFSMPDTHLLNEYLWKELSDIYVHIQWIFVFVRFMHMNGN